MTDAAEFSSPIHMIQWERKDEYWICILKLHVCVSRITSSSSGFLTALVRAGNMSRQCLHSSMHFILKKPLPMPYDITVIPSDIHSNKFISLLLISVGHSRRIFYRSGVCTYSTTGGSINFRKNFHHCPRPCQWWVLPTMCSTKNVALQSEKNSCPCTTVQQWNMQHYK
jgi:hypothetical protein